LRKIFYGLAIPVIASILIIGLIGLNPAFATSSFILSNSANGPAVNQADHPDDDHFECDPAVEDCTADSDGDGVPDWDDDCPSTPGTYENYGCPEGVEPVDSDGDGLYDYEDECPFESGPWEYQGCPSDPMDPDGDGIVNEYDECPNTHGGANEVRGCPDSDADGVPDKDDQCPDEMEDWMGTIDGCAEPSDADGDGVPDSSDACPNEYGTQSNGCPLDSDGDGVPDDIDQCPNEPGNVNGCPAPTDTDGDGIPDSSDACPNEYGTRSNGCPVPVVSDYDNDGVPDSSDACPTEYGTQSDGCPVEIDYGGYSSWDEYCQVEYGSEYYYDELEDACLLYSFDSDGDGIPDSSDACPNEYGTQSNGCPVPTVIDSDGDGIPDSSDVCPNEYGTQSNGCPVPVKSDGNTITVNFDAVDTSGGIVSGSAVENYLAGYGIDVIDEGTGTLRDFTIWEGNWDKGIYAIATSPPNGFFRNYGNEAYSYSLHFDTPLDRFEFTRASYDASFGGIATSPWNAQAFDSNGNSLGTVGEGSGSYYSIPPPVVFSFDGPDIAKVTFFRNSINTFAGIAQVPLDNLVLTIPSFVDTELDSDGDGIPDEYDSCPYEYGPPNNYGCPEVEPDVSPELERLANLGMEAYENGDCDLALDYFNQALALHEYEVFVKWFIGAIYSDCIGDHKTALPYLEDALALAKSTPEIPEEIIVEIQKAIDLVEELLSTPPSTTPSTQFLDLTGTWKGTIEFSVWFDYYPAPVTCSYVGNLEMNLRQTGNSVTGTSSLDVTKASTPTGCFSWFESYGYGNISGDVFGSAFSGTFNSNQFTGRFTSDLFEGEFSQQGTNSVSGSFSLMRQDAHTVPKSITPTLTPIIPSTPAPTPIVLPPQAPTPPAPPKIILTPPAPTQPAKERVPSWIKNNAGWWADGKIGQKDFVGGIQHLIQEKIINIPDLPDKASDVAKQNVPDWIKNNAGWWADGLISEDDFVNGIKWLVENGVIRI